MKKDNSFRVLAVPSLTIQYRFNFFRDTLKRNYNLGQYWLEINLEDLAAFDESLAEKIQKLPTEYLSILEEAAKDVADELTAPRPEGEEKMEDIQVLLCSDAHPSSLRGMKVISQFSWYIETIKFKNNSKWISVDFHLLLFIYIVWERHSLITDIYWLLR